VLRAIRGELGEKPELFRTFFIREMIRIRDYWQKDHVFTFWKERDYEVDLLVDDGSKIALAIQISLDGSLNSSSVAFSRRFPDVPLVVASLADVADSSEIKPWREVIGVYEQIP
jgi:predicted AAA+ superfamily ATPase